MRAHLCASSLWMRRRGIMSRPMNRRNLLVTDVFVRPRDPGTSPGALARQRCAGPGGAASAAASGSVQPSRSSRRVPPQSDSALLRGWNDGHHERLNESRSSLGGTRQRRGCTIRRPSVTDLLCAANRRPCANTETAVRRKLADTKLVWAAER